MHAANDRAGPTRCRGSAYRMRSGPAARPQPRSARPGRLDRGGDHAAGDRGASASGSCGVPRWAPGGLAVRRPRVRPARPFDAAAAERGACRADLAGLPQAGVVRRGLSTRRRGSGTSPHPTRTATRPAMPRRSAHRYGLHPAPYPNDGLPMGLRRGIGRDGVKTGLQIDCMACHGGSIGGKSYVGLGNTQLDLRPLLNELTIADGRRPPPLDLHPQHVPRDQQRRHGRRRPAQPAQSGPLVPHLPHAPGRQPPRDGHPRLVAPEAQADDVLRRPHRRPIGPDQHAVHAGREDPRGVQGAGADLPRPPGVPAEPRAAPSIRSRSTRRSRRAARSSSRRRAPDATGPTGPGGKYPNKIVAAGRDRHRSGAGEGPLRPPGGALQRDLAGRGAPGEHREESATRPRRSTASGPPPPTCTTARSRPSTPCSTRRAVPGGSPARRRPTSSTTTPIHVGWKFAEVSAEELASTARRSPFQAKFIVDTARFGMGNGGHTFGDDLSEDERMDLIEYLKTL